MNPKNKKSNPSFKPLIATSLALALSMSVTSAGTCPNNQDAICYGTSGTTLKQFDQIIFGDASDFKKLQKQGTPNVDINNLTFKFTNDSSTTPPTLTPEASKQNDFTLSLGGNNAVFQLTNVGAKGLQMNNGSGVITIDFGQDVDGSGNPVQTNFTRNAILNFTGKSTDTALKGNIKVIASASPTDKLTATFGGNMEGNITIGGQKKNSNGTFSDFANIHTEFTFSNGATLKGNIEVGGAQGGQDFIFEGNGGIELNPKDGKIKKSGDGIIIDGIKTQGANIIGGGGSPSNVKVETNITFKGATNTITTTGSVEGKIVAEGDGTNGNNAYNRILFDGEGQIGKVSQKISIKSGNLRSNNAAAKRFESQNLLLFKKEATLNLENLETKAIGKSDSRNVLSLEGEAKHNLTITNITAQANVDSGNNSTAVNLIGKGFLTFIESDSQNKNKPQEKYAKDLIENTTAIANPTNANIAEGTLNVGTIEAIGDGINKIFIRTLKATTIQSGKTTAGGINLINTYDAEITTIDTKAGGKNFIAQNITESQLKDTEFTSTTFLTDKYAMQGTLKITEGISSTNGGINNISFKAKHDIQNPIISKTTGEAISGSANIYLNLEGVKIIPTSQNLEKNIIKGNIKTGANQTINLKIKGAKDGKIGGKFVANGAKATNNFELQAGDLTITDNVEATGQGTNDFTLIESTLALKGYFKSPTNTERNELTLHNSKLIIENAGVSDTNTINELTLNDSEVIIGTEKTKGTKNAIKRLNNGNGKNSIDFRSGRVEDLASETQFNLLTIGDKNDASIAKGLLADGLTFKVFVDPEAPNATLGGDDSAKRGNTKAYSDRIVVETGAKLALHKMTHYVEATAKKENWNLIKYRQGKGTEEAGNIAVAIVKNGVNATFVGGSEVIGFETIQTTLTEGIPTDVNGKIVGASTKDYKTYFVSSLNYGGITQTSQDITASAMGSTYALYLANFNSLNKRMGELRDTTNAQGVWARVFNGSQSLNFGIQSQTIYTTIQAGYDYAVGFEGANNYIGFALSYANSTTKAKNVSEINGTNRGITSMTSNAIEFALYNAYVQNGASSLNGWSNGLYSDSILKFSYITSDAKLVGATASAMSNTAFTLSEEVGYRFLLGDQQWFITPQAEVAFGYLSRGNLNQKNGIYTLNSTQENIITLSNRIGSDVGYTFDIPKEKGFQAKLYLGTYFVYDYLIGGEINSRTGIGTQSVLTPFTSSAKGVINVGTNLEVKDNTRIYFDFERSFGGKVVTDYQINLGVRYGFGEKGRGVKKGLDSDQTKE
ncbi:hypothetical protein BBW65_06535 [Helicobacter enhydrae]|uniref:Autotransporter domain-containing protein n=1 Tax=Helicobacter enhydrae TaxID=222136 RepID=A0A1B1U6P9_9HELI|nr:autotransporter outer membrane beta-barrel domain-containing protein [Helicobacter enhydrae]ANV98474.1 hypothetical protein BBW65_06535 [Helicobacter enhydrae]